MLLRQWQPELRAAFRDWRRRRPFWGGLLLIAAGLELLIVPLSPFEVLVSLGLGGLAALGIGLALILAGGFLWVAPHTAPYVSLNALLLSVLSFAATNLGGFVVGSLLGIAGSALAFGWKAVGPAESVGPVASAESDGSVASAESAGPVAPTESAEPAEPAEKRGTGTALLVIAALLTAPLWRPATEAHAAEPPQAAAMPPTITTTLFAPEGFTFAGVEELPTRDGPLKVMVLRMDAASLTDYDLNTRDAGSPAQVNLTAGALQLRGNVTLYLTKFSGCLQDLVCLTFTPDRLPVPPVVPPFVYMTDVSAEQALVTTDELIVDGLGIQGKAG
ncbi:hypothetical protein G5C51_26525 [Streptomyces sp. A7024]|uniref:Integral membrane protein n=1 Tax=Streptomyces coryli TaxID=1128680 RepID=A0A6G4U7T1_9ACTN|nr:DUF6114 domain-containing protein [Streptomyces coryli]NGN67448.1 hypothetical protein [Streptomyces coryli]